jgi:hypothetical protein
VVPPGDEQRHRCAQRASPNASNLCPGNSGAYGCRDDAYFYLRILIALPGIREEPTVRPQMTSANSRKTDLRVAGSSALATHDTDTNEQTHGSNAQQPD